MATKPPANNFLQQQAKFDGFIHCYGRDIARPLTERPSRAGFEARGMTFVVRIRVGDTLEAVIVQGTVEIQRRAPTQFAKRLRLRMVLC
jgi:hypothetical protein